MTSYITAVQYQNEVIDINTLLTRFQILFIFLSLYMHSFTCVCACMPVHMRMYVCVCTSYTIWSMGYF